MTLNTDIATSHRNERTFDRGAWMTVLFVIVLFLWGALGMLYFFALPTDGWLATPPDSFGEIGFVYKQNLMGAPSELQANDHVIAIGDISLTQQDLSRLEGRWQAGQSVRYTVERNGSQIDIQVPIVRWRFASALGYWAQQGGGAGLVGEILFLAIAALAFYKRPGDSAARLLLIFAALFPALTPFLQTTQSSPTVSVDPTLNLLGIVTLFAAYSVLFPPVLLQLAMVFPHPKPSVGRHPWLEFLPYAVGLAVIPFFFLGFFLVGFGWTIFSILGAIVILIHSAFTMRDALSRAQLLWGVWGFVLGMIMFLSTYLITFGGVTGFWADVIKVIFSQSSSVLGITLAIAILRYRLFDIGIIIRRTLVYSILTAMLAAFYFGSVIILQQILRSLAGTGDELSIIISTLAVAVLFNPLRHRVQNMIDLRFYRRKYNSQQVIGRFAATVRDEVELEKLTDELIHVVRETMQPTHVSLWLKKTEDRGQKIA